ncbi:SOS response-associated peptidase [Leptospira licerasiae]|uniref:Abasic site processing protein n=1 Tax=Leptospira licerasiae str. MMD4847 TaxID=1049971 RepID=A0ABP2RD09_9LEPT|nr:SOS response-associated peptidase family protein [Leptospira licerasiae]EIE01481.1 hypothetical protein LEP1GSC185_3969 [Leptospira licerasiae serovar Varillal str. VAR 010]EJZ42268.1 hypothetical protein LEP1GSC178_0038 [Leptospira licerasiae str. MMD4847]
MCGRYSLNVELSQIIEQFGLNQDLEHIEREYRPEKEINPTRIIPVVKGVEDKRTLEFVEWGAKNLEVYDKSTGKTKVYKAANPCAKYESLYKYPPWLPGIKSNRCIIPMTSYWEWIEDGPNKGDRYEFFYKNNEILGVAGIISTFKNKEYEYYQGVVIVMLPSNPHVSVIHKRQPGFILPNHYDAWLDLKTKEPHKLIHQVQGEDYHFKKVADGKKEGTASGSNRKAKDNQMLLF